MRINGHCLLLGELLNVEFGHPMLHADSQIFPLFVLSYHMCIRTACFAILVKNTTNVLKGIAPYLLLHASNWSAFWTIQGGSVMAKLPFLFFRELLWTKALDSSFSAWRKNQILAYKVGNTGHCYREFWKV